MQIFAIVVSLALTAVAVVVRHQRRAPDARRDAPGPAGDAGAPTSRRAAPSTMLKETFAPHPDAAVALGRHHALVRLRRRSSSSARPCCTAYFQLFDPEFALPLIGHFFLYEWVDRGARRAQHGRHRLPDRLPPAQPPAPPRAARAASSAPPSGRPTSSRRWRCSRASAILFIRGAEYKLDAQDGARALPLPGQLVLRRRALPRRPRHPREHHLRHRDVQDRAGDGLAARDRPQHHHGRRLAPLHRVVQHLVQARARPGRTALGALKPLTSDGKAITLDDIDDLDEDSTLGVGSIEDFSWKGILDFTTCTECGRCQSQCPAWNTEKPLSPKLLITALRDAAYAKAPYLPTRRGRARGLLGATLARSEVERPLVGDTGDDWFYKPEDGVGGHRPRRAVVLHVVRRLRAAVPGRHRARRPHHRHAPLPGAGRVELPRRAQRALQGPGEQGQPVEHVAQRRAWTGPRASTSRSRSSARRIESLDEVDWLFWVGCAGAYEDRAKKTTRAVAELLDMAGVSFGVLGNGETCTGDPARRAGNEFVFQGLAQQNVETFKEYKVKKVVSTCAHCFNTLKNEYKEFGVELEVVHHTQLLNRLVREGKLTPVTGRCGRPQALDHLPRPVLHRPPQRRLHAAARAAPDPARRRVRRDGAQLREVLLLRRRRRPHVDGGEASASGSTSTAPRRPSAPAPTRSRSAARSAG